MNRSEQLRALMKARGGVHGLAKYIAATGAATVSEHELVSLATEQAKRQYGIGDGPRAFSKLYSESATLQQAVAIIKSAQVEPDATGVDAAYQKLQKLADDERRRSPHLTSEQAFARVATDPANAALAKRAIPVPAATTSFSFPR